MSGVEDPVEPIEPGDQVDQEPIELQPPQSPEHEVIVLLDSDAEDDPEEGPDPEEMEDPIDEPADPEMMEALVQMGALVHQLLARDLEVSTQLLAVEAKAQQLEQQVGEMQVELHQVHNERDQEIQKREEAEQMSQIYRHRLMGIKRKADIMNFTYLSSVDRVQHQVWTYPDELGQFRNSISRARVIAITEDERRHTVAHRIT